MSKKLVYENIVNNSFSVKVEKNVEFLKNEKIKKWKECILPIFWVQHMNFAYLIAMYE